MNYVKTDGMGNVTEFPYNLRKLRNDFPNTSFPQNMSEQAFARYNVFPVTLLPKPTYNPATHRVNPDTAPTLNGSTWELGWDVTGLTAQEQQARMERAADIQFENAREQARPAAYDELDIEVLKILRHEVWHFDNGSQGNTPLCAVVASELGVAENAVRNTVRTKGNQYYLNLVTSWAQRRAAKGGA